MLEETVITSKFKPAPWLRNRHAQTIYSSFPWVGIPRQAIRREYLELPDGDITAIDWAAESPPADSGAPILVILHGLEGSAKSPYARMLLKTAANKGWRAVVLNFRDCGDTPNRLPRRYHAGETLDIRYFLESLQAAGQEGPMIAAGYSLGGNVLLKYLGESGTSTPLSAAVAVSVPLNLHDSAAALSKGFSKIYERYLIKKMKSKIAQKFDENTSEFDWQRTMSATTFDEFDDAVTAPLHGFDGKNDYYDRCSSLGFLAAIRRPTLIINSLDDPFLTPQTIPDQSKVSDTVKIELTQSGGHVGFIEGGSPWKPTYYLPGRIMTYLSQCVATTELHARSLPGL